MRKKVLALVLAVCMVLTLLPVTASANAGDTGTNSTKLFTSVKIDDVEVTENSWFSTWNIFQAKPAQVIDLNSVDLKVTVVDGAVLKYGVGNSRYPTGKGELVDPEASPYKDFKSSFDDVKNTISTGNCYIWILATKDTLAEVVTVQVKELAGTAVTNTSREINGPGTYKVTGVITDTITVNASGDVTIIVPAGCKITTTGKPAISVTGAATVTITVNGEISGSGNQGVIANSGSGTLSIGGPGKITGTSTDPVIVNNGGTLTLKGNLTIENETPKSDSPYYVIENKSGTLNESLTNGQGSITSASGGINNAGMLNVTGGSITAGDDAINNTGTTAEIKSVKINGTIATSKGAMTLTSVTSDTDDTDPSIKVTGTEEANVTINSGIYYGGVQVDNEQATVTVSKGTFYGEFEKTKGTITISGGQFIGEATRESVNDFLPGKSLDGTGTVINGNPVAEIDGVQYADLGAAIQSGKGKTVKLLEDVTNLASNITLATAPAGEVTLDLNGKHIVFADKYGISLSFGNKLIVKDKTATTETGISEGGYISNGSSSTTPTVSVASGATFELLSGVIKANSTSGNAIVARTLAATTTDLEKANIVIKGGKVESDSYTIFLSNNANLTVEGGEVYSKDSFAISGNGNGNNNDTSITISGGKVTSENSVAIYHPQQGTMTVTEGEISGKAGIVMRAGELTVEGGKITATGDKVIENVGVTGRGVPASAIVADETEAYGAADTQPEVHISGGEFEAAADQKTVVYTENSKEATEEAPLEQEPSIEVSGGTFKTNDKPDTTVNTYVAPDKVVSTESGQEGKVIEYTNKILGFGYGATRQEAQAKLKEFKPDAAADKLETATSTWGDQTMFILFEKNLPDKKVVTFTITNGTYKYTDTCVGDGKSNLFAWSFLNEEQTPGIGNVAGTWTLSLEEGSTIDMNGKTTVEVAPLPENAVHFAILNGNVIPEKDGGMTVTAKTDDTVGQYYEVRFDTEKLPQTDGGNSGTKYWLGWALAAPDGAAKMTVTKADTAANALNNAGESKSELEHGVVNGKDGYALYYQADKPATGAEWVRVTWQDAQGKPMGTTFIHVTFGNITYKPADSKEINAVENGSGFKADKAEAENAIKEVWDGIRTSESGPDDVADNTIWAIFNHKDPQSTAVEYSYRVRKDGATAALEGSTGSASTTKGLLLYFSFDDKLQNVTPKGGKYIFELLSKNLPVANAEVEVYEVKFVAGEGVTFNPTSVLAAKDDLEAAKAATPEVTFTDDNNKVNWTEEVSDDGYTITLTATGSYDAPAPVVPGPTGTVTTSATVTTPAATNGSYTVSDRNAKAGDTVTITPKADEGYTVDTVVVTDKDGKDVTVTDNGDGTYTFTMPEKASQPVTVKVTFRKVAPSEKFTDVAQDAWYAEAINYVVEKGLMDGTGETTFAPNDPTNRAMLVTILYRLEGKPAVTKDIPFSDVASGEWYSDAINWAAANEIVDGYGDDTFRPTRELTREEAATILYRYAAYKEYDVTTTDDLTGYTDAETVSTWADTAMSWAVGTELINGMTTTTLVPSGGAIRAQIATILMRFCENIAK